MCLQRRMPCDLDLDAVHLMCRAKIKAMTCRHGPRTRIRLSPFAEFMAAYLKLSVPSMADHETGCPALGTARYLPLQKK